MDWYYDDEGRIGGPCSTNELQGLIERGLLLPDVPVRPSATSEWRPFDEVAVLKDDTPAESGTAKRAARAPTTERPRPKSVLHYLLLHWRGELELYVSFWINTVLLNLLLVWLLLWLVGLLRHATSDTVRWLLASIVVLIVFDYVLAVWQFVGSWRSAERHIRETSEEALARIIQMLIVVGVSTSVAHASQNWALVERLSAVAFGPIK